AFATVTYNGVDYEPYWDIVEDKCLFIGTVGGAQQNIDGTAAPAAANIVQLATAGTLTTGTTVAIDAL
ncbi:MAG: hypothetical protein UD936_06360, partial [Acutalibacteraceae bacterium]|nr:hypothetical protein [Acutalibacteraceae bacterium]